MVVRKSQETTKYQRVRNELVKALHEGQYSIGQKLPSERDLAKQFNVSPLTIRQALAVLDQDGFITKSPGRGTFVRQLTSVPDPAISTPASSITLLIVEMPGAGDAMFSHFTRYYETELRSLDRHLAK